MRKSRDIKFKNYMPIGSGMFLLLLMVGLVCPIVPSSAFAEETPADTPASDTAATLSDTDAGIMPTADNGVTITFSPTTGSASLTPTTSEGSLAKIDVTANVKIASTGGYTIYLGGRNAALTGAKTGATIPGATTATTFNNMKTNTWGYAYAEGSSVPDTATYSALPQGQGESLKSVSGNNTNINHTYALSFATKIGNDKPADTYSNQVTLSVTSSPLEVTGLTLLTDMQEMTSEVCETSEVGDTKQLRDVRDGKYYWVAKLKDNNCWMTQNLDYKPTDSYEGYRESDSGPYAPTTADGDVNAHAAAGGYYNWDLATKTGGSAANGQATDSICPHGWKLPIGGQASGSFYYLLSKYLAMDGVNIAQTAGNAAIMTRDPLYFVMGGSYGYGVDKFFSWGSEGDYRTSSATELLYFDASRINPADTSGYSGTGYSVRCVAR